MLKVILIMAVLLLSNLAHLRATQFVDESVEPNETLSDTADMTVGDQIAEPEPQERLDRLQGNTGRHTIKDDDDAETKLMKQRANFSRFHVENMPQPYPGSSPATRIAALQRLLTAEIELAGSPENVLPVIEEVFEVAKRIETEVRTVYLQGKQPLSDLSEITFFRMDVELQLLRARAKAGRAEKSHEEVNQTRLSR